MNGRVEFSVIPYISEQEMVEACGISEFEDHPRAAAPTGRLFASPIKVSRQRDVISCK